MKFLYKILFNSISLCITFTNCFKYTFNYIYNVYHYISSYSSHHIWYILPNYNIPICLSHIHEPTPYLWKYSDMILYNNQPTHQYRLSWLSANIHILNNDTTIIISMDDFIEHFRIKTHNEFPSLYIIFIIWCIYFKKWTTNDIIIHIIDLYGEEQSLSIKNQNNLSISHFYQINKN